MTYNGIITGFILNIRMLLRRRIVLFLLLVIPLAFLTIVDITTPDRILPFKLASYDEEIIESTEKSISFVFLAGASAGFLLSYLGLNIIQKNIEASRRLIICGFSPHELLLSKLLTLNLITLFVAVYIGLLSSYYFSINNIYHFTIGLFLIGFVYSGYGFLAGSIIKGELEGILMVLLLVNIDVGWLQNPAFFAEAENQLLIKFLPAYYPSQTTIIGSFTDYSISTTSIISLIYGIALILLATIIFYNKMRIRK